MKLLIIFLFFGTTCFSQKKKFKYKKYEKFDFKAFAVEGDTSNPGDISVNPRFRVKFKNKLPSKESFNKEALDALDMIQ